MIEAPPDSILVRVTALAKSYAGVHALDRVSFELRSGEVHAIVGENGAGKSTLIKVITGAITADSGTLEVRGRPVPHNTPSLARSLGIAPIYQQPSLFPGLSVAENIALTLETSANFRRIDWKARRIRAAELLRRAGSTIDPDRLVESLSMPEQQIVEIAKAIGANARILIMDEPTASLTDREVESLFDVISAFRREGAGIIYISHRLEEITAIADRVTVLRDGQTIATRAAREIGRTDLVRLMAGRELSADFPKRTVPIGDPALEVRRLFSRAAGVHDISFSLRKGEILGLAGLIGSGRTQLAETLFGLHPVDSGEILVSGAPVAIRAPSDAIRFGIAYVPEDRRRHGVVLEMAVAANVSLANLRSVSRSGMIRSDLEDALASRFAAELRIKTASIHSAAGSLSGGNQQKVALSRWLATSPRILIVDEPTQGVDVASKAEIHRILVDLAGQGLAILMISSELPEILGMSDRIAVMRGGAIAGIIPRAEATQSGILALALGHADSPREQAG